MSIISQITNHDDQAKNRVITQYKDSVNLNKIISVYTQQIQEFEDAAFALINERTLDGSIGFQLDQMGTILDEIRNGLDDDDYRIVLKAKIAENVSEGTPEDLIGIFKVLLNPEEVHYNEIYPAGFELTAIGDQDPVSSIERVKQAINRAKPAGVELVSVKQVTRFPEFSFLDDPDPTGGGFRDLLVLSETSTPFVFFDDPDPNGIGLGDANNAALGGDFSTILATDDTDTLNPTAGFFSAVI